mmetsp:Transcript_4215/g.12056  ORF Transcript_4215/g.12056 Transcript_4215/m.12056 type:complete len:184 (+) Transcript_4215:211-762(+)
MLETRRKAVLLLSAAFKATTSACLREGGAAEPDANKNYSRTPDSLAEALEAEVFAAHPSDREAYSRRVKTLRFNLGDNARLRHDFAEGLVTPRQLAHMSTEELASAERRSVAAANFSAAAFQASAFELDKAQTLVTDDECPNCHARKASARPELVLPDAFWTVDRDATQMSLSCQECGHCWRK